MKIIFIIFLSALFPFNGGAIDVNESKSNEELDEIIDGLLDKVNLLETTLIEKTLANKEEKDDKTENNEEIMLGSALVCEEFKIKLDDPLNNEARRNLKTCDPKPSTNIKNVADIAATSLGILEIIKKTAEVVVPEFAVPFAAFGAIVFKSILDLSCMNRNGDNALTLDAAKVAYIAKAQVQETANDLSKRDMKRIDDDVTNLPYVYDGNVPASSLLVDAEEYWKISVRAQGLGVAGYQTAAVALSHSINLYRLVFDAANSANQDDCAEIIKKNLNSKITSYIEVETGAFQEFEDLKTFMKDNISTHFVTRWWLCSLFGDAEYQARTVDHNGNVVTEVSANYHNTRGNCLPDQWIKNAASDMVVSNIEVWANKKRDELFSPNKSLFANIRKYKPYMLPTPNHRNQNEICKPGYAIYGQCYHRASYIIAETSECPVGYAPYTDRMPPYNLLYISLGLDLQLIDEHFFSGQIDYDDHCNNVPNGWFYNQNNRNLYYSKWECPKANENWVTSNGFRFICRVTPCLLNECKE